MATRWESVDSRNAMRNKENTPFSPHVPYNPSPSPSPSPVHATDGSRLSRPSLARTPGSQPRFITDSFLQDDSTRSTASQIPSPSYLAPTGSANYRRKIAVRKTSTDTTSTRPKHRSTRSEFPASSNEGTRKSRPKPAQTRHMSLDNTNGLSTPPRSRQGSFSSPNDIVSSPPPALTDNYARIDQEEELAMTETDLSDPEDEQDNVQQQLPLPVNAFGNLSTSKRASTESFKRLNNSRGSTPTDRQHQLVATELTTGSVMSEGTGMSFVNQLTNENLRDVVTRSLKKANRPVAFAKAGQISLPSDEQMNRILFRDDQVADAVSLEPRLLPERQVAFTKAKKIHLPSDRGFRPGHQRSASDHDNVNLDPQALQPLERLPKKLDDDIKKIMPHNPLLNRPPFFAKTHGFPERGSNNVETNGQVYSGYPAPSFKKAKSASPIVPSVQPVSTAENVELEPNRAVHSGLRLPTDSRWRSPRNQPIDNTVSSAASSEIWVNSDKPIKSIEKNPTDMSIRSGPASEPQSSPGGMSRTINYELTGFSMQASDSPPIRVTNITSGGSDYFRSREMAGLSQRRVTTTQLHNLRERASQEHIRTQTKSPLSEVSIDGEVLFDMPLAQRTFSNGIQRTGSKSPDDRGRVTQDVLQRLGRASSSTPRSGSTSDKGSDTKPASQDKIRQLEVAQILDQATSGPSNFLASKAPTSQVEATPKVTGGWTDTILPDTVKTAKRPAKPALHAQTPHVNAGGWIDTPAPTNRLESVAESTQEAEVPAELMQGIVKDSASDRPVTEAGPSQPQQPQAPIQGAVSDYLDRVQNDANDEDTHIPGDATIHSLRDALNLDDTQFSQLMGLNTEDASDTQVLDQLRVRLERLSGTIHEAHTGVDRLQTLVDRSTEMTPTVEPTPKTSLRMPSLTQKSNSRLPRPTKLGWFLISIIAWYIIECTMAELYSHPTYAEHYVWPSEPEPDFPLVLPTMLYRWCNLKHLTALFNWLFTLFRPGRGDVVDITLAPIVEEQLGLGLGLDYDEYV